MDLRGDPVQTASELRGGFEEVRLSPSTRAKKRNESGVAGGEGEGRIHCDYVRREGRKASKTSMK